MHTAGKVLLIIGGVLTAIGIGITVMGAASASLDPSSENAAEGTSFTFTIPDDDIYGVYTKSSVNCDALGDDDIMITKSGDSDTNYFNKDCEYNEDDDYLDDGYQRVGSISWLYPGTDAGDVMTIDSDVKIYIVGDIEAFGDAVGGIFAAAGGILIAVCGGVILLIGIILALTLKSKEPVVVMQQGGQMMGGQVMQQPVQPMQQMQQPVQQMPQQTTQQGYEFEQK